MLKDGKRSFVVDAVANLNGCKLPLSDKHSPHSHSRTPASAAKKAMRQLYKSHKVNEVVVEVRETTRGGLGKTYKYVVKRTKLNKPVTLGDAVIKHVHTAHKANVTLKNC